MEANPRIRNVKDVRAHYGPGFEELASGEIWYKGWDIPDHFVLGKVEGKYVAMYSLNSHGFGMDEEVSTPEEFEKFFSYLDENDHKQIRQRFEPLVKVMAYHASKE